jgi:type VI secretion system protein ImpA
MNIDKLSSEISPESPCGDDLEYDPDFGELERTAGGKPEHVMGDEVVEAEPPDWREVKSQAEALFDRTKDLRVAVLLARAELNINGLSGFADGLGLIRRLLEDYWDTVYPLLDEEDDNDPTFRVNTIINLADEEELLKDLLNTPIVRSTMAGQFTLRDVRIAKGDLQAPADQENVADASIINAAFMESDLDELVESAGKVDESMEHSQGIDAVFNEKVGAANGPDLQPLFYVLKDLKGVYAENLTARGVGVEAEEESAAAGDGAGGQAISGDIRSREDAIRMIDKICVYFERHEPSSPVPLLLYRAKRLISKDFLEILRDLTPDGVTQAESIGGVTGEE